MGRAEAEEISALENEKSKNSLVKRITNLDAPWEQAGRVHR